MGGTREDVLPQRSSTTVASKGGTTTVMGTQKIRIHESNRKVHFHDDDNKLKAAVPVDTWFRAWTELMVSEKPFVYYDLDNMSLLTVMIGEDSNGVEATIRVEKLEAQIGATFKALQKFTLG